MHADYNYVAIPQVPRTCASNTTHKNEGYQ